MIKKLDSKEVMDSYFYIYSDCFITSGKKRFSILDTANKKIHFINNEYYELVKLFRKKKISEIISLLDSNDDKEFLADFITCLLKLDLGRFVSEINKFPQIEKIWDSPSRITNALIDVRDKLHDFNNIFEQLNILGCRSVEIRSYAELSIVDIRDIIVAASANSVTSLKFLIKYEDNKLIKELGLIVSEYTFVYFHVYSIPAYQLKYFREIIQEPIQKLSFSSQKITSCNDCGIINKNTMIMPSVPSYMENLLYNGCLNRKISIDELGNIKNCPSFKEHFGNISEKRMDSVVNDDKFRSLWYITKKQIDICCDCELRCICSDCRAHLINPANPLSKPLKCKYTY